MKDLSMLKELKRRLGEVERDDLLEMIGLEERRTVGDKMLPGLAMLGAGVLLGVGIGLLLAPKPGAALREDLKAHLGQGEVDKAQASQVV